MSKKSSDKETSAKKIGFFHKTCDFFRNEKTKFTLGICTLIFAAFLFLSMVSFFFTGAYDQSSLENLPLSQLTDVRNNIQNWTGFVGAYIAELFINRWIGIGAFFICIFFGAAGLTLMKVKVFRLLPLFIYCSVLTIWSSLFFGFFFISGYEDSFIYLGGKHGYYISLLLKANIGWFGTFLVILGSFIIILSILSIKTIEFIRNILHINIPDLSFLWPKKRSKDEQVLTNNGVSDNKKDNAESYLANEATGKINKEKENNKSIHTEEHEIIASDDEIESEEHENNHWVETKAPSTTIVTEETPIVNPLSSLKNEETVQEKETTIVETKVKGNDEKVEVGFTIQKGASGDDTELVDSLELADYDPTLDLSKYKTPSLDLLNKYEGSEKEIDIEEQNANKKRIEETLRNYGIEIQAITATVGPTITLYEIIPKQGVRIAKIRSLEDDIALSLAALGIRIIAPIPGKGTVGIEVPNKDPQMVSMYSIIASRKFAECKYELPVALGKTITNEIFMLDLTKMPHVLVAGATGQGKSVGLNAIITSLLYKKHPSQLKFVLIDPKKVEFNIYSKIEKHFLAKLPDSEEAIITDVTKVVATLNSICKEMDERYDLLKMASTRNIKEYNHKFQSRQLNPEKGHRYMPYIVVIVDEFGDLIMTAGKEVELPIARIAQLARAVGIHMIIATQRPSTNIITGIIKANFPARIAFRVSSMIDSRTILDTPGANQLIGRGDMLFSQGGDLVRIQCAFVDTPEVEKVSECIGEQQGYPTAFLLPEYVAEASDSIGEVDLKDRDQMFEEAARLVVANQQGSTSMIQRKFSIGYNRAGRIMDQLEAAGIVGPFEGSKARQVLVMDDIQLEQVLGNLR
ncbi:MAG: DNA translocase FtsK [Bacteroidales bacterium]|nr:DNA translocase FtsK [Bacteroidales bacterium]